MSQDAPYNQNAELVAMRDDIANRSLGLKIKEGLILGACTLGGAALGAVGLPMIAEGAAMTGMLGGGVIGLYGGAAVADLATSKDRTKLDIDNQMVESYMSGKNYWGEGYREEVAEKGYGFGHTPSNTPMLAQVSQGRGSAV